jgi:hypothetical protein
MKRRTLISMATAALLASLVASPAATASPGSGSASVTFNAAIRAKIVYTVVDHDHIELRSNAPWRLTLVSAEGVQEVSGPRTGSEGALLEVPEGTTDYFVTLER